MVKEISVLTINTMATKKKETSHKMSVHYRNPKSHYEYSAASDSGQSIIVMYEVTI